MGFCLLIDAFEPLRSQRLGKASDAAGVVQSEPYFMILEKSKAKEVSE